MKKKYWKGRMTTTTMLNEGWLKNWTQRAMNWIEYDKKGN